MKISQVQKLILLSGIFFSITNFVPLSVLPVISLFFIPIVWGMNSQGGFWVRKIPFYCALILIYCIVSTALYEPSSFLDFSFYRRDGNIFVTYTVFLCAISITSSFVSAKHLYLILLLIALFSFIVAIVVPAKSDGVKHLLFVAHNAAGGFYSVVASVALGFWLNNKRNFVTFFILFTFVACLILTNSRGSLLALFIAFFYSLFRFKFAIIGFLLLIGVQIAVTQYTYPYWVLSGKSNGEGDFSSQYAPDLDDVSRGGTLINRLYYLWPRAWDQFKESPIVGTGFGSYDDLDYKYRVIVPGVLATKESKDVQHSDSHAHNSLLTILAELGIVGALLFFLLFKNIWQSLRDGYRYCPPLALGLQIAFWDCLISAGTEHRITTPSQMVPFFLLFSVFYHLINKRKELLNNSISG